MESTNANHRQWELLSGKLKSEVVLGGGGKLGCTKLSKKEWRYLPQDTPGLSVRRGQPSRAECEVTPSPHKDSCRRKGKEARDSSVFPGIGCSVYLAAVGVLKRKLSGHGAPKTGC